MYCYNRDRQWLQRNEGIDKFLNLVSVLSSHFYDHEKLFNTDSKLIFHSCLAKKRQGSLAFGICEKTQLLQSRSSVIDVIT